MTLLSIKIKIGNREYPMKVDEEDEEKVRNTGKLLNEKIKYFQSQFKIDDGQDLLAMVAFDCMVEKLKKEEISKINDDFALDKITKLNHLISDST